MSWISENKLSPLQKFCINVLKCGPIPHHVAFIMDGNRRYARKQHVAKAEGHSKGFDKLSDCLNWCLELGIKEVTVYAFSIENFKRTKDEVDQLMDLAREKFQRLFEEKDKLMENGVCIRVIGNLTLLPDDLKKLIARAMLMTKDNKNAILNVAFSYTSRDEIAHSIMTVVEGAKQGKINVDDINESVISHCLYTNLSRNPDLLIRTSGEVRLSDFLLWQCANSQIFFAKVLWPEFNIWHLLKGVFYYQRGLRSMENEENPCAEQEDNWRISEFIQDLNERRLQQLEIYASS